MGSKLNCKVVVTDLTGTPHQIYPQKCTVTLDGENAGSFSFVLEKTDSTLRGWLLKGCTAKFYIDTTAAPSTLKLTALTEKISRKVKYPKTASAPTQVNMELTVTGKERFYIDTSNIRVAETYEGMTINAIVVDLLANYLPAADYSGHDIDGPDVAISKIHFNYRPLKEVLDILATYAGAVYSCSPAGAVKWKTIGIVDSGYTYTDAEIEASPSAVESLIPLKNVVYGAFGLGAKLDVYEDDVSVSYQAVDNYVWAHQFQIVNNTIRRIGLYVGKTGTPIIGLMIYLAPDNGSNSPGIIDGGPYTIPEIDVPAGGGWVYINVNYPAVAGSKYWVAVNRTTDSGNCYNWFIDPSWIGTTYRAWLDTSTWNVQTGYPPFCYRIYTQGLMLFRAHNAASEETYRTREYLFQDNSVTDMDVAMDLVNATLNNLLSGAVAVENLQNHNITDIPNVNELVTLALVNLEVNESYAVRKMVFAFNSGIETKTYCLDVGDNITDLSERIAEIKRDTSIQQVNGLVVDDGVYPVVDI